VLGHASSPTRTAYVDVTVTRSKVKVKVKVTDHLNFWQLPINAHFQVYLLRNFRMELKTDGWHWQYGTWSTACRSPIFEFPFEGKVSLQFKLHKMSIFHVIQMATYFGTAWCYSNMVGYTGSPTYTVYVDVTLTRSKVKVKIMWLLNFPQLAKPCMLAAMTAAPCGAFWFILILSSCTNCLNSSLISVMTFNSLDKAEVFVRKLISSN